jgi:hypothetical protein
MGPLDSAEEGMIDHKNRGVRLKIVVSDSGVGIDPERLRHIFEPYSQAKLSDYRIQWGLVWDFHHIQSLEDIGRKYPSRSPRLGKEPSSLPHCALQVPLNQSKTIEDSNLI